MLFKKKKIQIEEDRIWTTTELKWNGIVDEILTESAHYFLVLAVVHFKKTADDLRAKFQARNVPIKDFEEAFSFRIDELKKASNPPFIVMAERISELEGRVRQLSPSEMKDRELLFIIAEHHPLYECDETLLSFMPNLPSRSRARFHSALDEPLLKIFGAERTLDVLKRLGLDEKQYISHRLISSAIEQAQKKIKDKATGNQRVDSIEEWFYYNFPRS